MTPKSKETVVTNYIEPTSDDTNKLNPKPTAPVLLHTEQQKELFAEFVLKLFTDFYDQMSKDMASYKTITLFAAAGCSVVIAYGYNLDVPEVDESILFKTPVGDLTLQKGVLSPDHHNITAGIDKYGFTCQVKVSIDFNDGTLTGEATIGAPFVGHDSGSFHVKLW